MLTKDDQKIIKDLLDQQTQVFDNKIDSLSVSVDKKLDQQTKAFDGKLDRLRNDIMLDVKTIIEPLKESIDLQNQKIDRNFRALSDDIIAVFSETEKIKRRVSRVELKLAAHTH